MFRFFVEKKVNSSFELPLEVLKHIKVTRISDKNFICIYKNEFYETKLVANKGQIIKKIETNHEFEHELILACCLIKWKKFDLIVQKAAELGVSKLIPIISENVSIKLPSLFDKKVQRWNEIAKNACQQAFRNKKMVVEKPLPFKEIVNYEKVNKFIAHEKIVKSQIPISFPQDSLFLIGPEGGFSNKEISLAEINNFQVISLGKRVLRAETASFFVLSRVN